MRRAAATVALLLAVTGCAVAPAPVSPPSAPSTQVASAPAEVALPVSVTIPAIKAESTLIETGLNLDGTAEVPPLSEPGQASWATWSPTPGEPGPAVLLGHVDGAGQPGVFARLDELAPGDEVLVARSDGTTARFVVRVIASYAKELFPTAEVYGATPGPDLRLITCGGVFDRAVGSYRDNTVVYASLA